jgi:hypothetical protein
MKHVIRTQIIDVTTTRKDDVFELQQMLSDLFYQTILPVLEKVFDELTPGSEIIQIDKIEIQLGVLNVRDLSSFKWNETITEIITADLESRQYSADNRDFRKSESLSAAEQWLYYMKHGHLPWNMVRTDKQWLNTVLAGLASEDACIQALRSLISTDINALKRIVYAHDNLFIAHLIETLTAKNQHDLLELVTTLEDSLRTTTLNTSSFDISFSKRTWMEVLRFLVESKEIINSEAIIKHVIKQVLSPEEVTALLGISRPPFAVAEYLPELKEVLEMNDVGPQKKLQKQDREDYVHQEVKTNELKDGVFVQNAGVVLLHPFLVNLFNYLGLTENQEFLSIYEKQKALNALHFLCTGNTTFEEHELVVHKIICEYPLEEPVDPDIRLSLKEQEECNDLLKEVVERWSILKNTSPDGLRVNFLQRPGKLYMLNSEPHLTPEASVLDVLIDRLPWGLGIVKLPWMKNLLKIEWR